LWWLNSIRESEADNVYARNPHELARALEVFSRLTVSEMIIHASLARKASSAILDFKRLDYPETDPPEWNKFITIRQEGGWSRWASYRSTTGCYPLMLPPTKRTMQNTADSKL